MQTLNIELSYDHSQLRKMQIQPPAMREREEAIRKDDAKAIKQ